MTGTPIDPVGEDVRGGPHPSAERLAALEAQVGALAARLADEEGSRPVPADSQKLADRFGDRVDVLAGRIDTLSETARSASGAVVARERELVDLKRELGELRDRVERAVADLYLVDRAPVEEVQRTAATVTQEVATLRQEHDLLDERVGSLASATDDARADVADQARSLAELRAAVEASGVRMDSVVSIVRQAVEGLLSQAEGRAAPADGSTSESRLEQLTREVAALADDARRHAAQQEDLRAAQGALWERLDELARQLTHEEPRPRLVTWAAPYTSAATEGTADADAEGDAVKDTTGSIASLGGGR